MTELGTATGAPAPTSEEIDAAWEVVREYLEVSPMRAHGETLYKCEMHLPTGAFKVRGALAAMSAARARGISEVVAASAGNHGAGVAFAAKALGMRAAIVVPSGCPEIKKTKMRDGAEVIVAETPGYDETEVVARALAAERGAHFLSPFDDTDVMAGNGGTMARELLQQVPNVGAIVLAVGGGGLLSGIVSELRAQGHGARVVAVQSEMSPAFARSLADETTYTTWPHAVSLAEGLEGGTGHTGVRVAREAGVVAITVTEAQIARAMVSLRADLGIRVEGSAAVVEAARQSGALSELPTPLVLVLCGGNVSDATLDDLQTQPPTNV